MSFPSNPTVGQQHTLDGRIYIWSGVVWNLSAAGGGGEGGIGPTGATGPQGPAGNDGADGANGIDGVDGADGLDGATGATGPQGPVGNDGPPGANGIDGAPGADGMDGAPGADGLDGATGATGPQGLSGFEFSTTRVFDKQYTPGEIVFYSGNYYICLANNDAIPPTGGALGVYWGIYSFVGPQGVTGPAGADGTNGNDGAPGPAGADGLNGSDGATGATGPIGVTGVTGPAGADGADGAAGATGATGPQGPAGTGSSDTFEFTVNFTGTAPTSTSSLPSGWSSSITGNDVTITHTVNKQVKDVTYWGYTSGTAIWHARYPNATSELSTTDADKLTAFKMRLSNTVVGCDSGGQARIVCFF